MTLSPLPGAVAPLWPGEELGEGVGNGGGTTVDKEGYLKPSDPHISAAAPPLPHLPLAPSLE